ncbi:unnamed protein product [Callosobruchus maculatus]|uniref:Uncharacterized protein n=1 Tax=Callosobruchus maculatus TaxID=64391 RepID=A0A653C919_CALMS|nr:unnamed protein product [Callosobruchus maculatus]
MPSLPVISQRQLCLAKTLHQQDIKFNKSSNNQRMQNTRHESLIFKVLLIK